jgi:hypothetical protein
MMTGTRKSRVAQIQKVVDNPLPQTVEEVFQAPAQVRYPGAVTNDAGQIAIRYYQTIPKVVTVNKHDYVFVSKHNVSLSWVAEDDVFALLNMTGGCCGNKTKGIFKLASLTNVNLWRTGDR